MNTTDAYIRIYAKMAFRECGTNSLPELLVMLLLVALVAYGIAFAWVEALEELFEPGEMPNMAALHVLNLITGFLYVGLIRESKEEWVQTMKTANDFMLTSHSMVLAARENTDLSPIVQRIDALRKQLIRFYRNNAQSHITKIRNMVCCNGQAYSLNKVKECLLIREKMHALHTLLPEGNGRLMSLFSRLESILGSIETKHFAKEPSCFKWHLRLLLLLYFGTLPVQLYNAYDRDFTLIVYPVIVYFLFSVAILASVFVNPIEHPELSLCFEELNIEIMKDVRTVNGNSYMRALSLY